MFSFDFLLLSSEQTGDLGISILGTFEKFSNTFQYFESNRVPQNRLDPEFSIPHGLASETGEKIIYSTSGVPNSYLGFFSGIEGGKACEERQGLLGTGNQPFLFYHPETSFQDLS